jgi:hypothetical protein
MLQSESGHGTKVCEFGTKHSRCRCMSTAVVRIMCPTPNECRAKVAEESETPLSYVPKHKREPRIRS